MKTRILSVLSLAIIFAVVFSACDKESTDTFSESEPNDSFSTANALTINDTYDCEINPIAEQDFFKITASGDVTITVDGGTGLEVRVHLFDQEQIDFWGDDAGERGATLTHTVLASDYDGFFYVRVESAYGNDTGTYTIKYE